MLTAFFKPYIGEGFKQPENNIFGGMKILVVGHNHYCNKLFNLRKENPAAECGEACKMYEQSCHEFTINTVARFIDYCRGTKEFDRFMNTFSKFANALSGYNTAPVTVWENIAFYNFCQSAVSFDAEQPEQKHYINSEEAFFGVLKELKPDVIICWGRDKVYMNTPSTNWTSPTDNKLGYYTVDGVEIPMFAIHHPSWPGFSPSSEHEDIKSNINKFR